MALKISSTFKPLGDAVQRVWWGFHPLLQITRNKYLPEVQDWNPWRMSNKSQRSKRYTKTTEAFPWILLRKLILTSLEKMQLGGRFPEQLQGSDLAALADVNRSGAGRACVLQDWGGQKRSAFWCKPVLKVGAGSHTSRNQHFSIQLWSYRRTYQFPQGSRDKKIPSAAVGLGLAGWGFKGLTWVALASLVLPAAHNTFWSPPSCYGHFTFPGHVLVPCTTKAEFSPHAELGSGMA